MFTGLVERTGALASRTMRGTLARLRLATDLGRVASHTRGTTPLELGESIAVDGVCLTVVEITSDGFEADATPETLARTTLGDVGVGAPVNLERSLTLGERLGGHLVTGHVDATSRLVRLEPKGDALDLSFELPGSVARFVAEKGSIAVSGVSLTVNAVGPTTFDVMIIPHTQSVTNLGRLTVGSRVNIEIDLMARYAARWLEVTGRGSS